MDHVSRRLEEFGYVLRIFVDGENRRMMNHELKLSRFFKTLHQVGLAGEEDHHYVGETK